MIQEFIYFFLHLDSTENIIFTAMFYLQFNGFGNESTKDKKHNLVTVINYQYNNTIK